MNETSTIHAPALIGEAALTRQLGLTKHKLRGLCALLGIQHISLTASPRARRHYTTADVVALQKKIAGTAVVAS